MEGIPIFKSQDLGQIASSGVRHAIVAAPELSQSKFAEVMERGGNAFPYLILIPDTDSIWKSGAYTRDLMGILGIQVRNNLLDGGSRIAKRTIDLASSTLLTLFLLPLMTIISLLIVIESGFPVFYFDKRLGHGGGIFHMWKFRTMARHSAEVLDRYLASSPELQKEWAQYQKLRNDPRITRVGRVLRKTSLDELPQLWNVIKGEMSLVGPRPRLMEVNVPKYQVVNSLYARTTPGLTGLWQVSGRNRTTYEERIAYDAYYIRNWSVWMDIYLLAKTVGVVLTGDGAY
jgi:Undecaprenyl-phosphate galactose phosphotransferase WbaP